MANEIKDKSLKKILDKHIEEEKQVKETENMAANHIQEITKPKKSPLRLKKN